VPAPAQVVTAMNTAIRWHTKPTTVPTWKISWNPNQRGEGLGRLNPYTTAPRV